MTFSKEHILYFLLIFLQMDLMTIQQIVHSLWVPTIVTPSLSQPQAPFPTECVPRFLNLAVDSHLTAVLRQEWHYSCVLYS